MTPTDMCTCSHSLRAHPRTGTCLARDSYGQPCGCWEFERDAVWSGDDASDDRELSIAAAVHDGPHLREPWEKPAAQAAAA